MCDKEQFNQGESEGMMGIGYCTQLVKNCAFEILYTQAFELNKKENRSYM